MNQIIFIYFISRRTFKDVLDGKIIRRNPDGYENFNDYWTDSGKTSRNVYNMINLKIN